MLDFMRRNAASWGIKVALGIISLVMVLFFGGAYNIGGGVQPLATVGDKAITQNDFELARQRTSNYIREQAGGNLTDEMLRSLDIPSMALARLVDTAVLVQEAERLGLTVPDEAVKNAIQSIDAFKVDGVFSPTIYRRTLRAQGLTPSGFEASMREDLLTSQLTDFIRRGVHVTEDEAYHDYLKESRKLTLAYVTVPAAKFRDTVEIDEAGLEAYYADHAEQFRRPESVKVRYLRYSPEHFAKNLDASDEEVEEYYTLNEDEFRTEEQVSARHILKKIPPDADDETRAAVRKQMEEIAKRIAEGEDFAELAKTESEDVGSAANGGDLGTFSRGHMVKPFEQAAFALEVGEVSGIVETDFGLHLIKVYGKVPAGTQTMAQARAAIIKKVKERKAEDLVFDASAEDAAAIADGAKLDTIAAERGLRIEETTPFAKGDIVAGIGQAPEFVNAAVSLARVGDSSDNIKVGDSYYIIELAERRESYIPGLPEVRDAVEELYRNELATEAARAEADKLLASLREGRSLEEVAEAGGYAIAETDPFQSRGQFIAGLGSVPGLKDVAFRVTKDGEPLPRPFIHRGDALVFVRRSLIEGNRSGFDTERASRMDALLLRKQQEAVQDFLRRLKENAEITYNEQMMDRLLGRSARRQAG